VIAVDGGASATLGPPAQASDLPATISPEGPGASR
jgi:hypothetical protein